MTGRYTFLTLTDQLTVIVASCYTLCLSFFIMDTKRITKEELKELSDRYTSPCVECATDDGCPSPAECEKYKKWRVTLQTTSTVA